MSFGTGVPLVIFSWYFLTLSMLNRFPLSARMLYTTTVTLLTIFGVINDYIFNPFILEL